MSNTTMNCGIFLREAKNCFIKGILDIFAKTYIININTYKGEIQRMNALLGILYFVLSAVFGLGCSGAQIMIVLSIVKSVKANNALKLDPDNTALAEDVKKCKKNMFIWIGVAVACIAMVLVTYFAYIILLAIFNTAM